MCVCVCVCVCVCMCVCVCVGGRNILLRDVNKPMILSILKGETTGTIFAPPYHSFFMAELQEEI